MQDRILLVIAQGFGRRCQLIERYVFQRPAVRQSYGAKFVGGLGQRHIQTSLAAPSSLEEKLQRERRLPRTRFSFYEIEPVLREPASKDLVQTFDTRCDTRGRPAQRGLRHAGTPSPYERP